MTRVRGRVAAAAVAALLLAGCAATVEPPPAPDAPADAQPYGVTEPAPPAPTRFEPGLVTPLHDLNLMRVEIPPVLLAARLAPFARPDDLSCAALAVHILELDAVLGVEPDTAQAPPDDALIERGADLAVDAVEGLLQGALAGVIPFRRWVRMLTGAERHAREVAAAIVAGSLRRAYLKGLGDHGGCEPPAAPRR